MANSRVLYPAPLTNGQDLVTLKFRLQYTANALADFVKPAGAISSNTRTSEGLYTMTLNEMYPVFIGGFGHVMVAAANAVTASSHYVAIDPTDYVATTGVLTYRTLWHDHAGASTGPGVLADIADNDWVYFELTFARRSGGAPTGAI
jgi:hypothetical protein